jgi:hypothetical protein
MEFALSEVPNNKISTNQLPEIISSTCYNLTFPELKNKHGFLKRNHETLKQEFWLKMLAVRRKSEGKLLYK